MLMTVLLESIDLISSIYSSKVFSQVVNLSNGPVAPQSLYNYVDSNFKKLSRVIIRVTGSKPMGQWVIRVNTCDPVATLAMRAILI